MEVSMHSVSVSKPDGTPVRMNFDTKSSGRRNQVEAIFRGKLAELSVKNSGSKTRMTMPLPAQGQVVDDPLTEILHHALTNGSTRTVYVFDPATMSFLKNRITAVGSTFADVRGKKVLSRLIRITDPTSSMEVFLGRHDEVIRVNAAMGITMFPVSKEVALAPEKSTGSPSDLAVATSIRPDKPISNPETLRHLKLRITSPSIREIPSDQYQVVKKDGKGWTVDITPPTPSAIVSATIFRAAADKPEWLRPSLYISSDSMSMKKLAARIIGSRKDVDTASFAIQSYVYQSMRFNSGIGVLRDASEILATKEGVCRDFAVLTVTLLRASGIPAKLASGLVNGDGAFYYHAWAQAWDGKRWIGVDSTTERAQLSASHVKLGEGNIDTAFTFSFLDSAKIEVLSVEKE
jgi:transglutaminase-like putative cysteine protease